MKDFGQSQINKIELCPEANILVAANEDSMIQFYDLNTN